MQVAVIIHCSRTSPSTRSSPMRQPTRNALPMSSAPMAAEGLTALALVAASDGVSQLLALGLCCARLVTASTVLLQVPLHSRLAQRWNAADAHRLVQTNWIRTVGWSVRGVLALVMVAQAS